MAKEHKGVGAFVDELEAEDEAAWMMTYADMVTLLLTYFIVMYAMMSFKKHDYEMYVEKLKEQINKVEVQIPGSDKGVKLIEYLLKKPKDRKVTIRSFTGITSKEIIDDIQNIARKNGLQNNVGITTEHNKIVITVRGGTFFKSGQAKLNPMAGLVLDDIAEVVRGYPEYKVNIHGHTDDRPIKSKKFPSNWELSSMRATAVLRYLLSRRIDPSRLAATGNADSVPLVANDTHANRAKNRRVEFVLEKE
jgi:chemotaxis protein MotB